MEILHRCRNGIVYEGFRFGYDPFPAWFQELKKKGIIKVYNEDEMLVLEVREEKYKLYAGYVVWVKDSDLSNGYNITVVDKTLAESMFDFKCNLYEEEQEKKRRKEKLEKLKFWNNLRFYRRWKIWKKYRRWKYRKWRK